MSGDEIFWPSGMNLKLNPVQLPFVQHIDGCRTIRGIVEGVAQHANVSEENRVDLLQFARKLFESLWRLDFVAMALNAEPTGCSPRSATLAAEPP